MDDARLVVLAFMAERLAAVCAGTDTLHSVSAAIERRLGESLGWEATIRWDGAVHSRSDASTVELPVRRDGNVVGTVSVQVEPVVDETFRAALVHQLAALHAAADLAGPGTGPRVLESMFESAAVGIGLVGPDGTVLRANGAFCALLGRDRFDAVGADWADLLGCRDGTEPLPHGGVVECRRSDGSSVWLRTDVAELDGAWSHGRLLVVHVTDVSDQVVALERSEALAGEVVANERRYRSLIEPSVELVVRLRIDGRVVDANEAALAALGLTPETAIGAHVGDVLPADVAEDVVAEIAAVTSMGQPRELWRQWLEFDHRAPGWFVLRVLPEQVDDEGYIEHAYLVATDISELVESERRLATMAHTDPLTGIANRAAIVEHATQAVEALAGDTDGIAIALVDLDDFKFVNDRFGHAAGDRALEAAAAALQDAVRPGDVVGRLGGDEFVVVLSDVDSESSTERIRHRLTAAIRNSRIVLDDGTRYWLSGSVGIVFTREQLAVRDLLAAADRSMYEVKERRRRTGDAVGIGRGVAPAG